MKKNKYVLLSMAVIACILSFVSSCKEEEPVNMAPVLELYGTGEVMRQSVLMMGSISGNMGQVKNFGFQYSISDKFPSDQIGLAPAIDGSGAGDFHVHVPGLKANTTYFYRAYATTGAVEVYSHIDQFTTLASSAPRITHLATGEIGEDMVSFFCRIDEVGDEYLYEYGIQYRKSGTTDPYISVKAEGIDEGYHYEVTVSGLEAETNYEFRPYAQNSDTPNGENGFRVGYGGEFKVTTTNEKQYLDFLLDNQQAIVDRISSVAWFTARAEQKISKLNDKRARAFSEAFRKALPKVEEALKVQVAETPYGVPYRPHIWGAGWDIQSFGYRHYFLVSAYPEIFSKAPIFNALNFILGCHPGSNQASFASGVGAESATVGYGLNRADWSYIPGGVISGTALIRPDFPELLTFPFLWQQTEYVLGGGSSHYMFLVLAAQQFLQ